jgi:hypothetical protein
MTDTTPTAYVNHPNRGNASYRFVAFSTITGHSQAYAATAKEALALAAEYLPAADFVEILDCGDNGRKVWTGGGVPHPFPLCLARMRHRTVFRGPGYADSHNPLPPVPLAEGC